MQKQTEDGPVTNFPPPSRKEGSEHMFRAQDSSRFLKASLKRGGYKGFMPTACGVVVGPPRAVIVSLKGPRLYNFPDFPGHTIFSLCPQEPGRAGVPI